ncbi:histone RNA hairpin-binding domain containing protein [Nitzschia inconspicua]|uniref:Histone RNA hairpin-binding domain containing protein n=1 Tax=Nitzschia inconspicua TaxID=303405 RepID=A0A9K3PM51_9STRA|nr:histone RNA hairpin-binding domain containing protein [Nitzschia inconspicua]
MGLKSTNPFVSSSWRSPPAVATLSSSVNNNNDDDNNTTTSTSNAAAVTSRIKPTVHKRGNTNVKKIKFHSASCMDRTQQETAFHPLDVTVPQQAHKIRQRQKTIAKGKNTIGYDEYRKQVPLHKRHKFSMETPSTPDPTLDIPNKQWNGMVKAWRIALHKYDPVDLQQSFAKAHAEEQLLDNNQVSDSCTPSKSSLSLSSSLTVKERELEQAKSMGLLDLVQLGGGNDEVDPTRATKTSTTTTVVTSTFSQNESVIMQMETTTTTLGITENREMSILDEWEQQAQANGEEDDDDYDFHHSILRSDGGDDSDDDDDDDDLL